MDETINEESEEMTLLPQNQRDNMEIDLSSPMPILMRQAQHVADSGICKLNDPSAILTVWLQGKELGVPAMSSLNNIDIVKGKPILNKHLVNALLKKSGWTVSFEEDFVDPGNGDRRTTGKFVNVKALKELNKRKLALQNIKNEALIASLLESMAVEEKTYTQYYSFYYSQAASMGLTGKDNWVKMPQIMMQSRVLALGGRLFAPDAIMGIMETSEWAEVNDKGYVLDEGGAAILE